MYRPVATQPQTNIIWFETGVQHSSQWAEPWVAWLVCAHEPWPIVLHTDSWAIFKVVITCLAQ